MKDVLVFAIREIRGWSVYLDSDGYDVPGIETALIFETWFDPTTCLELSDGTHHLGVLRPAEEVPKYFLTRPHLQDSCEHSPGLFFTHHFSVITSNIYMHHWESWEEYKAKPKRFGFGALRDARLAAKAAEA